MLMVVSPAKTLDFDTPPAIETATQPAFVSEAKRLMAELREFAPQDVARLMKLSDKLGTLNYDRYQAWQPRHTLGPKTRHNTRQAILAFRGDVYTGLDADSFSAEDFGFAQDHLRILSGLYGLLRPLDLIHPYRLEMGTRLQNPRGKDLYAFWGDKLTEHLNREMAAESKPVLLNLASNEYFKAINSKALHARVISPVFKDKVFKDKQKGQYKIVSFYAKKARGMMAAYVIKKRIDDPAKLRRFNREGYRYHAELSTPDQPVFTRDQP